MKEEFESAKKAMGNNILLNSFDVTRRSLVITDASGQGFGHVGWFCMTVRLPNPGLFNSNFGRSL